MEGGFPYIRGFAYVRGFPFTRDFHAQGDLPSSNFTQDFPQ